MAIGVGPVQEQIIGAQGTTEKQHGGRSQQSSDVHRIETVMPAAGVLLE